MNPANPAQFETYTDKVLLPKLFPQDHRLIVLTNFAASLTLAEGTVVAKDTGDGKIKAYAQATAAVSTAIGILKFPVKTDSDGTIFYGDSTNASANNLPKQTAPAYIAGTFDTDELTGWDAAAAADFNAVAIGDGLVRIS